MCVVFVCVQGPEKKLTVNSSGAVEAGSLSLARHTNKRGWLVSKPQRCTCLQLSSSPCPPLFIYYKSKIMGSWNWIQVLVLARQAFKIVCRQGLEVLWFLKLNLAQLIDDKCLLFWRHPCGDDSRMSDIGYQIPRVCWCPTLCPLLTLSFIHLCFTHQQSTVFQSFRKMVFSLFILKCDFYFMCMSLYLHVCVCDMQTCVH